MTSFTHTEGVSRFVNRPTIWNGWNIYQFTSAAHYHFGLSLYICPIHLKLVIMWLLLGRLICSDGMLLIWWCKLDITFSRTLVNYPSALCFFLSFFFRLLLSVKKLACMLSAKTGMSSSPRTSRRATELMWRSLRQTLISTNDAMSVELVSWLSIVSF